MLPYVVESSGTEITCFPLMKQRRFLEKKIKCFGRESWRREKTDKDKSGVRKKNLNV